MKILLATQRFSKMGHTFKKQRTKFDDDMNSYKNKKHHSNNRKYGGLKIINSPDEDFEEDLDYGYKYDYEEHLDNHT